MERTDFERLNYLRTIYRIISGELVSDIEEEMKKHLANDKFELAMCIRAGLNFCDKHDEETTYEYLEEMKDVIEELGEEQAHSCMERDIKKYDYYYQFKTI